MQESGQAEVQSIQQHMQPQDSSLVMDEGVVAGMDAWAISQCNLPGLPMEDLSASSVGNRVISAFIALNEDLQLKSIVLDVVGEDM